MSTALGSCLANTGLHSENQRDRPPSAERSRCRCRPRNTVSLCKADADRCTREGKRRPSSTIRATQARRSQEQAFGAGCAPPRRSPARTPRRTPHRYPHAGGSHRQVSRTATRWRAPARVLDGRKTPKQAWAISLGYACWAKRGQDASSVEQAAPSHVRNSESFAVSGNEVVCAKIEDVRGREGLGVPWHLGPLRHETPSKKSKYPYSLSSGKRLCLAPLSGRAAKRCAQASKGKTGSERIRISLKFRQGGGFGTRECPEISTFQGHGGPGVP